MAEGAIGGLLGKIGIGGSGGGQLFSSMIAIVAGVAIVGFCGFGLWFFFNKKKNWNIKVEFKIPRNVRKIKQKDGSYRIYGTLNKEWGKGFYNAKNGVVMIKRKGKKAVPMKPFDIKRHLSSGNILTVMQIGIEDYRPILDDSYIEVVDDKTGEEGALIRAKIDTSEGKAWRNSWERERKNVYTILSWMREHGQTLAIGLVVFVILVGFAIMWTRMPSICG